MTTPKKQGWLAGSLIFFMPVTLILFLGSQAAYSQGKGRFETYLAIPEISTYADLSTLSADEVVILSGEISAESLAGNSQPSQSSLLIFQERPADGREVRFREEFPLTFPAFMLNLPDGQVPIIPSDSDDHVIQAELHTVPAGDRVHTGFQVGDKIYVQGKWQPDPPALLDVTGVTSVSQANLIPEWQQAFRYVAWARNGLGVLSVVSIIALVIHLRRAKAQATVEQPWSEAHV